MNLSIILWLLVFVATTVYVNARNVNQTSYNRSSNRKSQNLTKDSIQLNVDDQKIIEPPNKLTKTKQLERTIKAPKFSTTTMPPCPAGQVLSYNNRTCFPEFLEMESNRWK